jgi:lysophospholipid acyltransferase (LPLAT)-like uncharacterized protein
MIRAVVLSCIAWIMISLWGRSVRTTFVNRSIPDKLDAEGRNHIYAFWHGRQFLLLYNHKDAGIILPSSESRDGEIQARILKRFGYGVVRGSSKRKGDRALLGLVDGMRKGKTIALAVDGPRGPLHEVKQGVTYLAGKLDKPIIPVSTGAKRYWILEKIWDKYLLPVPFTKGVVIYGDPIIVRGTGVEELALRSAELANSLNNLTVQANNYFQRTSV